MFLLIDDTLGVGDDTEDEGEHEEKREGSVENHDDRVFDVGRKWHFLCPQVKGEGPITPGLDQDLAYYHLKQKNSR